MSRRLMSIFGVLALVLSSLGLAEDLARPPLYTEPVIFPLHENGIEPGKLMLDYSLNAAGDLRVGNRQMSLTDFDALLIPQSPLGSNYTIQIAWPSALAKSGVVVFFSKGPLESNELLRLPVDKGLETGVEMAPEGTPDLISLGQSHWKAVISEKQLDRWPQGEPFQFCIQHLNPQQLGIIICSPPYRLIRATQTSPARYTIRSVEDNSLVNPQIFINAQKTKKTKGLVSVSDAVEPMDLDVKWTNAASVKLRVLPPKSLILDDMTAANSEQATVTFTRNGQRSEASFYKSHPWIFIDGEGGIPLRQPFSISRPVFPEGLRPYIKSTELPATYSRITRFDAWVAAKKGMPENPQYSSTEESLIEDLPTLQWQYLAERKGQKAWSALHTAYGGESYTGRYAVYRAYPLNVSANFTTLGYLSSQLLPTVDLRASGWAQNLLGCRRKLCRDRWGVGLHYMQSLTGLQDSFGDNISLSLADAEVRFLFSPAVAFFADMAGATVDVQSLTLSSNQSVLVGPGVFLKKRMPDPINRFINHLRFLRMDKWLNLRANYFPMAATGSGASEFSLQAGLQVLFTRQLYGNLGIGYFDILSTSQTTKITISALFSTIGVGYQF